MAEAPQVGDRGSIILQTYEDGKPVDKVEPGVITDIQNGIAFLDLDCGISYVTSLEKVRAA